MSRADDLRESMPSGPAAGDLPPDEATTELAILEKTDSPGGVQPTTDNPFSLQPDPIPKEWIVEGAPTARRRFLAGSSDSLASTHMWDCTAGRFSWHYKSDEVIYVLQGSVVVEDAAGVRRRLEPGDTFLFPAGTRFSWTVSHYVRKIAFLHAPLSRKMRLLKGIYEFFKSPFRRKQAPTAWTG